MSHTITIDEAAASLRDLIRSLVPGDEIVLTDNDQPIARIVPNAMPSGKRIAGLGKGMLTILVEDDSHLDDFKEYR